MVYFQLFFIQFLAFLIVLPPFFGIWGTVGLENTTRTCTIMDKSGLHYKRIVFEFGFLLPCIIIAILYAYIYYTVRKRVSQFLSGGSFTSVNMSVQRRKDDKHLTKMLFIIFCCLLICYVPKIIAHILNEQHKHPWFDVISSTLIWSTCVLNPFIYAASNRTYHAAYYNLFFAIRSCFHCRTSSNAPLNAPIRKNIVNSASIEDQEVPTVLEIETIEETND